MDENTNQLYQAFISKDRRFDGLFFVGVKSTGIYCRPVCPARTPKLENCTFFKNAAMAEKAMFRPCFRCRPELAPGLSPMDSSDRVSNLIINYINENLFEDANLLESLSKFFNLSDRQIRRIVQKELGVSPLELLQTKRLLLAKKLLTETYLTITEIAFASGFSSLRRFNDAFKKQYRLTPTSIRKESKINKYDQDLDYFTLYMSYRPPYDWSGILNFLKLRMLKGVEWIDENCYRRTIALGKCKGWFTVNHSEKRNALKIDISSSLLPVVSLLLEKIRHFFDLSARPDIVMEHFSKDEHLKGAVLKAPGLRIPGAFDSFELAVRAVLGQQITVKAATTLAARYVESLGVEIKTPFSELNRLTPHFERVSKLNIEKLAELGIIRRRAACIIEIARKMDSGELKLVPGANIEELITKLVQIPGIGPWTAQYIAMRVLRSPDAFLKEDIILRNLFGKVSAKKLESIAESWRPWRSYAVMYLWRSFV